MHPAFFWGKFDPKTQAFLPLAAHCTDVAWVFRHLAELPAIRHNLERAAGTRLSEVQLERLAVLAALHDVGKANLGFQRKALDPKAPKAGHIRELEAILDGQVQCQRFAEAICAQELASWFDGDGFEKLLFATWSHHGRPPEFKGERTGTYFLAKQWWQADGERDPMAAVAQILAWAKTAFPKAFSEEASPMTASARLQHFFAGLVMLADWLGSHPAWFPIEATGLEDRLKHDLRQTPKLLRAVGLDVSALKLPDFSDFRMRFGMAPRPMQAQIDALDPDDETTRLLILEAETGSGKTEAALNWFCKLFAAGKVGGLYFALPTRVAARELYGRVVMIIQRWFPEPKDRPVTVLAVPGYPQVDGLPAANYLPEADRANLWQDEDELRRRERAWAAERPKRFLAATVAVGTIDQALLSVVQTAHTHLRSACLSRSLLVVDEVHASDVYMGRLLEHLLRHHLALGGWALLLSATLGSVAKTRYLAANGGRSQAPSLEEAKRQAYPSLTLADGRVLPGASSADRERAVTLDCRPCAFQPELLADALGQALAAKAKVLIVLNTVSRANALLRAVEGRLDPAWLFACAGVVCPHHGRFAPADRVVLDQAVSLRFGKGSPSGPVLLIGTQTLEQSLDLDADLLVSDLAPMDVLLQRLGRLHRHLKPRPSGFETPRCLVLVPENGLEPGLDEKGRAVAAFKQAGLGSVYEDLRILELTRRLLAQFPKISLPRDNRLLVESATHPERLATLLGECWQKHTQEIEGGELMKAIVAGQAVIDFTKNFGDFSFNEQGGRVATRLGADSLELPMDRPFVSPFGQTIDRLVIPGHMKPSQAEDVIRLLPDNGHEVLVACGEKRYRYSRFGLEEAK